MRIYWPLLLLVFLMACTNPVVEADPGEAFPSPYPAAPSQHYTVIQSISLHNQGDAPPGKQNLWVALIRDIEPYQEVTARAISPDNYVLVTDEYDNEYAEFDLTAHPPGTEISIELSYQVTVFEQSIDPGNCSGDRPDEFTGPELHIESANPQIVGLAEALSQGQNTPCAQIRTFYDYVGDELVYTYNQNNWGAQAALGPMGADCTEYASLMIALSRAAGIPARYFEGLLYLGDQTAGLAETEHAWLEVYLPGAGWAAMDPTLGRSLSRRDDFFARHTPDHIIVTVGRNPSTLRGSSYWSHLYWPGDSTTIQAESTGWIITPID